MFNKKGLSSLITIILLLFLVISIWLIIQFWLIGFYTEREVDLEKKLNERNLNIEKLEEGNLYIRNRDIVDFQIFEILLDGNKCPVSITIPKNSFNRININSCLNSNYFNKNIDVSLISNLGTYTQNLFVESIFDCSTIPYGDWILVPGNPLYNTSDFCVMKYEAKNVGGIANSTASGNPWVSLTWQQAKSNCEAIGADYHLITDNEWLTIAKNAENIATNWNSSVVGTGFMYLGHNDNNPANSLAADTNDSNGYYGTNDGVSSPGDNSYSNFPSNDARAYQGQKRTLTLSNGEVIWDLAGNVWEWVNDSMPIASSYHGGDQAWMSYSSDDGTGKIASLVPALMTPSSGWNANNGMGRYYDGTSLAGAYNSISQAPDFCTGHCSPTAVFLRGGGWGTGASVGAFALILNHGPSYSNVGRGFRCTYTP
jgi:formylglycine-generating enzyme required for sulfatase activity